MRSVRRVPRHRMCADCHAYFTPNHFVQVRCCDCRRAHDAIRCDATRQVNQAVRRGQLPNLKAVEVACADCGARAVCYDHRDYAKPLGVVAVCHGCNLRRGPSNTCIRVPSFGSLSVH